MFRAFQRNILFTPPKSKVVKQAFFIAALFLTVGCIDIPAMNGLVDRIVPEEEREQIYWFAPDLDFTIVRILNNDGRESDLLLKSLEFGD